MEGESPTLTMQSMAEKTPHIPGLVQLIPDNEGESNTGRIQMPPMTTSAHRWITQINHIEFTEQK